MLFTFFGVAALYVLLMADFLAAAQVLIYVGGVLLLILFGVMLTARTTGVAVTHANMQRPMALFIVAGVLLVLLTVVFRTPWNALAPPGIERTTAELGKLILTTYLLPFEVVSILLLAALIGAVYIARREDSAP